MLGDQLKCYREAAGLTQVSLSQKAGVSLRTLQNWEQGHREPRLAQLQQLAALLGVSLDQLVKPSAKSTSKKPRGRPKKK